MSLICIERRAMLRLLLARRRRKNCWFLVYSRPVEPAACRRVLSCDKVVRCTGSRDVIADRMRWPACCRLRSEFFSGPVHHFDLCSIIARLDVGVHELSGGMIGPDRRIRAAPSFDIRFGQQRARQTIHDSWCALRSRTGREAESALARLSFVGGIVLLKLHFSGGASQVLFSRRLRCSETRETLRGR